MNWINRIFGGLIFCSLSFFSFFSFSVSHAFDAEFSSNNQQIRKKKQTGITHEERERKKKPKAKILNRLFFSYKTV